MAEAVGLEFSIKWAWAEKILPDINRIARDAARIRYTKHARQDRMLLRDVNPSDVHYCLMTGRHIDNIRSGGGGDVIYRVVGTCTEGKPLKVAVAITDGDELLVVTVIRRD